MPLIGITMGRMIGGITTGRIFVKFGKGWVYVVAGLIAASYLWILYTEGVWRLWETANPSFNPNPSFNLWNALGSLLINGAAIMLPGIALIGLGKILGDDH